MAKTATAAGADTARVMDFPTVLLSGDATQLVDVHAVTAGYPLRGKVRLSGISWPSARPHPAEGIPTPGTARVELPAPWARLKLKVGDTVQLGNLHLRIAAAIALSAGRRFPGFSALAPKVVLNDADVAASGLVNANSRVDYKLLVAGAPDVITNLENGWRDHRPTGVRLEDARDGRPELVNAIDRSQRFLALAALVSVLISAVAVVLAARRYASRYTDAAAILKCLGLTRRRVLTVLLLELFWLGLAAGIVGMIAGYGAQFGLVAVLKDLLPSTLPPPPLTPAFSALGIGLVLLLGFCAAAPHAPRQHAPGPGAARRDLAPPPTRGYIIYGAAMAAGFEPDPLAGAFTDPLPLRLGW